MEKMKIKQGDIKEAVEKIPSRATKERWVLTLDRDEGTFYYAPKVIPSNTELRQITDEYAVYFDKNLEPKGVMIEYYDVNFIKHHNKIAKISKKVFGTGGKKTKTVDPTKGLKNEYMALKTILDSTLLDEAQTRMIPA